MTRNRTKKKKTEIKKNLSLCQFKYAHIFAAISDVSELSYNNAYNNFKYAVSENDRQDVISTKSDLENKVYLYSDSFNSTEAYNEQEKKNKKVEKIQLIKEEIMNAGFEVDYLVRQLPEKVTQNVATFKKVAPSVFTKQTDLNICPDDTLFEKESCWKQGNDYVLLVGKAGEKKETLIYYYKDAVLEKYITCDGDLINEKTEKKTCEFFSSSSAKFNISTVKGSYGPGLAVKNGEIVAEEFLDREYTDSPFYGFSKIIFWSVLANLLQSWMSGLISKVLSSLMKNIFAAVATALIVVCEVFKGTKANTVPVYGAICIVILTALVFGQIPKAKKN